MNRWVWLLMIPTTCALLPWLLMPALPNDRVDNHVPAVWLLTDGSLPFVGILAIVAFGLRRSVAVPLLPQLPFVIAAVTYLGTAILISINNDDSVGWVSNVFFLSLLCFVLQPVLAAIGGLASVRAVDGL